MADIIPASEWGRQLRDTPPRPGVVTHLTVHWVGTASYSRPPEKIADGIKQIERGQMAKDPKLSAIGYNFLVDKWGRIWEGRGWTYRNAANGGNANNPTSMSVCVLVGQRDATPTPETISGLRRLWQLTSAHFGRGLEVQCHSDVRATACPGPELTDLVRSGAITGGGIEVTRISGANRYDTAAKVSKKAYPDGAQVAYIASGIAFPDALTLSSLATDGPILLTDPMRLPPETANELRRLKVTSVVIVGGTSAVSATVENQIKAIVP
ncbi:MAG TPA: cell wall-binding repeat-containing protein [Acidimicrobiia bacterium]